jgi:hypothetical protein
MAKGTEMQQAGFHPDLEALLEDPIMDHVMASDGVAMRDLVALLQAAQRRLAVPEGQNAKSRHEAGPSSVGTEPLRRRRGA